MTDELIDREWLLNQLTRELSESDAGLIAGRLADVLYDALHAKIRTGGKQDFTTRYLADGSEVSTNLAGTTVGLTGGDHAEAQTTKVSVSIAVCPGTYAESSIGWPVNTGTVTQIEIVGFGATPTDAASGNSTVIGATSGNIFDITTNPCAMSLRNLSVRGTTAINYTSGSNLKAAWEAVRFTGAIETAPLLMMRASRCWFDGALTSAASGSDEESLHFAGCIFTSTVNLAASVAAAEIIFDAGCRHVGGGGAANVTIGDVQNFQHYGTFTGTSKLIIAGGSGGNAHEFAIGSTFMAAPLTTDCNVEIVTTGTQEEVFTGRIAATFIAPTSAVAATTAFIKLTGDSGDKIFGVAVVGCTFGAGTNAGSYIEDRGGFSVIADHVNNCTFGPNAPSGKALYNVTNATMTKVDGVLYSSGVPSHTDNYGALYKNTATDILYQHQVRVVLYGVGHSARCSRRE
jgi:hypothetical protein